MTHTCIIAARGHALLRALKRALEPEFEVVAMADNIGSLLESAAQLGADLVVLDLDMLVPDHVPLLEILRRRCPEAVLVGLSEEEHPIGEAVIEKARLAAIVPTSRAASVLVPTAKELMTDDAREL